jgi:hypothetical protein
MLLCLCSLVSFPSAFLQVTLLHKATPATRNTAVTLKPSRVGATGQNLANTSFADTGNAPFPAGAEEAPFTNTYKPAQPLATFAGQPSAGAWVLRVADVGNNSAEWVHVLHASMHPTHAFKTRISDY